MAVFAPCSSPSTYNWGIQARGIDSNQDCMLDQTLKLQLQKLPCFYRRLQKDETGDKPSLWYTFKSGRLKCLKTTELIWTQEWHVSRLCNARQRKILNQPCRLENILMLSGNDNHNVPPASVKVTGRKVAG